jgi:hypothetical protein
MVNDYLNDQQTFSSKGNCGMDILAHHHKLNTIYTLTNPEHSNILKQKVHVWEFGGSIGSLF